MNYKPRNVLITGLFASVLTVNLSAAPKLRLVQTALAPVTIAQGSNGPVQSVDARNAGDGSLSLQLSSSATWLVPSLGPAHTCADGNGACIPIQMALQTASLAKSAYTGIVTVNDPNAIDAPQTIAVTVQIGGIVPATLEYFLPPNRMA